MSTEITSKRIQEAVQNSGKTLVELEQACGVPHAAIQRYATGKTAKIPIDRVRAIAKATRVSPAWLMGWTDDPNAKVPDPQSEASPMRLTEEEAVIIREYRRMTPDQQMIIARLIEAFQAERITGGAK